MRTMSDTARRAGRRTRRTLGGVAVAALIAAGCSTGSGGTSRVADGPTTTRAARTMVATATQLAQLPALLTTFAATPDGRDLLVGDRTGVVRRFRVDPAHPLAVPVIDPQPVLDVSSRVSLQFDRGFIGMSLVGGGRWLVVMYTAPDGAVTVEQYAYRSDGPLDPHPVRTLLSLAWPYPWHQGGGMALDGQGDLLLSLGDKGVSPPGLPAAQDPTLLLGGILRIPHSVLEDPTTPWTPSPTQMVARGMRNPWRFSYDAKTGDVWIGDVGDLEIEEVDRIPAKDLGRRQVNFGYPYYEGSIKQYERVPAGFTYTHAVLQRHHGAGVCGVVGGFVYHGTRIPALADRYVYTDLCATEVRSFRPSGSSAQDDRAIAKLPEPAVSIGQDSSGELYALGSSGGFYRLDAAGSDAPSSRQTPPGGDITTTTAPVQKIDCGIAEAIQPFGFMGGMEPNEVRDALAQVNKTLAQRVPALPAHLQQYGRTLQHTFSQLETILAGVHWDMASPQLGSLRTDMLDATGPFEGFPQALADLFDSECA